MLRAVFVPFLVLTACTGPADPGEALVDFADLLADDVYDAMWASIEQQDIDLWVPESGASFSGQSSIPADGEAFGVDGELSASWSLLFTESEPPMEGEYHWDWDFVLDIQRLALPLCEVAGDGSWAVDHTYYDNAQQGQHFEGSLALDGGEPLEVAYDAYFSGNLHWIRGTIGEVEVDWENPNPDLP